MLKTNQKEPIQQKSSLILPVLQIAVSTFQSMHGERIYDKCVVFVHSRMQVAHGPFELVITVLHVGSDHGNPSW